MFIMIYKSDGFSDMRTLIIEVWYFLTETFLKFSVSI